LPGNKKGGTCNAALLIRLQAMSKKTTPKSKSNPKPLTPDSLCNLPGCEHYSDEEAIEIIHTLDQLARIFLKAAMSSGTRLDNQESTNADEQEKEN
jgi:hypothetical protein